MSSDRSQRHRIVNLGQQLAQPNRCLRWFQRYHSPTSTSQRNWHRRKTRSCNQLSSPPIFQPRRSPVANKSRDTRCSRQQSLGMTLPTSVSVMIQLTLQEPSSFVKIQPWFHLAILAIRPSQPGMKYHANISCKNRFLTVTVNLHSRDLFCSQRSLLLWHHRDCYCTFESRGTKGCANISSATDPTDPKKQRCSPGHRTQCVSWYGTVGCNFFFAHRLQVIWRDPGSPKLLETQETESETGNACLVTHQTSSTSSLLQEPLSGIWEDSERGWTSCLVQIWSSCLRSPNSGTVSNVSLRMIPCSLLDPYFMTATSLRAYTQQHLGLHGVSNSRLSPVCHLAVSVLSLTSAALASTLTTCKFPESVDS